jgi:hypothetical protein
MRAIGSFILGDHDMFRNYLISGMAFAALLLAASPAEALVVRAWVSGHGNDVSGCGAPTNACRTLQYTFTNIVSAGGEIDILDPAGYGALTINHAISIVNDGVGTAGVQVASGIAITITAGADDVVTLRGLNIEGLGTASEGIVHESGSVVNVEHCVIHGFAYGFATQWSQNYIINIVDSTIAGNSQYGLEILPADSSITGVTISRVQFLNNGSNNAANLSLYNGITNGNGGVRVGITDSVFSGATNSISVDGVSGGSPVSVSIANSVVSNATTAIAVADPRAIVLLSRTTLSGNINPFSVTGGAVLKSYGNNDMVDNITQGTGSVTPVVQH